MSRPSFAAALTRLHPTSRPIAAFAQALVAFEAAGGDMAEGDAAYRRWRVRLHGLRDACSDAERVAIERLEREMGVSW